MTVKTKEEAQREIQLYLESMIDILQRCVMPLASEHKIEFSFLGMGYHLFPRSYREGDQMEIWKRGTTERRFIPRPPAVQGILVSDSEWRSSDFGCSSRYWGWHNNEWPETEED